MSHIAYSNNQELLQTLDEEGITLDEYITMLVEKTLFDKGLIQGECIDDVMTELDKG
jgi:hypothetical protein